MKAHSFWGNPTEINYDSILDHFSGTSIHSSKTSSVPLAQYWKDTESRLTELFENICVNSTSVELYFEYPTKSYDRSKSSMTDLMIIVEGAKIAIEAKYTEYSKSEYELVEKWIQGGKGADHRQKVLNHWLQILKPFLKEDIVKFDKLPYQFVHRSASACKDNDSIAFVVYQLFYDDDNDNKLGEFIQLIQKSIETLNPKDRLRYIFMLVRVVKYLHVDKKEVFMRMRNENIYEFGVVKYV